MKCGATIAYGLLFTTCVLPKDHKGNHSDSRIGGTSPNTREENNRG